MRPAIFEPQQIIEAGQALQAEGRNITGFALRNRVGGGNPSRLKQIWDEHLAAQTEVVSEPVAELPVEVAEEVKMVSTALSERISQLATELNDKAVRAAERRVAEVTRAAGEQTAQAERELADAAQTVDELESKLDDVNDELIQAVAQLEARREREQALTVELAQVRERLDASEKQRRDMESTGKLAAEQHREQVDDLQKRLDAAEKALSDANARHTAEMQDVKAQHAETVKDIKAQYVRTEADLLKRLETAEKALANASARHADDIRDMKTQHAKEINETREQHTRTVGDLQKRLDTAAENAVAEINKRQAALDDAVRDAASAREERAALSGEIRALTVQNEQLTTLLAGKA